MKRLGLVLALGLAVLVLIELAGPYVERFIVAVLP